MKAKLFRTRQVRYGLWNESPWSYAWGARGPRFKSRRSDQTSFFRWLREIWMLSKKGFKPLAPLAGGLALRNGRSSLHCSEIVHGSIIARNNQRIPWMDSGFMLTRFRDSDSRPNLSCIGARFGLLRLHVGSTTPRENSISWSVFYKSAGATVRTIALHSLHSITAISPPDYSTQTAPAVWISEVQIRNGCDKLTIRVHALTVCGGRPGATFDGRRHQLQIPACAFFTFAHRARAGFSGAPSTESRRTPSAAAVLCRMREAETAPSEKCRGATSQNRCKRLFDRKGSTFSFSIVDQMP